VSVPAGYLSIIAIFYEYTSISPKYIFTTVWDPMKTPVGVKLPNLISTAMIYDFFVELKLTCLLVLKAPSLLYCNGFISVEAVILGLITPRGFGASL